MPNSKLGVHINFVTEPDAMRDFILQSRPAVVKTLHHDVAFWSHIVEQCPDILFVGRKFKDLGDQRNLIAAKERGAEEFFRSLQDSGTWNVFYTWEGLNEIGQHPTHDYMLFELRLCELLHNVGKKYVAGSWSVGCPALEDWDSEWVLEVLRWADYVGLHEYCAPRMDDPRGFDPPGVGWFTLRYRQVWDRISQHLHNPPRIIISECGIDSGAAHWDPQGQGGWRSFTDAMGYLDQLAWYDKELRKDDCIVGATPFCWGTLDPTWDSFDITGYMSDLLREYIINEQDLPIPPGSDFEEWLARYAQGKVIPFNPAAKFRQVALDYGWESISDEQDVEWEGVTYRFQVFVGLEGSVWWQHIVYAPVGDWDNLNVINRPN